jgi:ABC-type antimicrobial peptide transport system permease subunit
MAGGHDFTFTVAIVVRMVILQGAFLTFLGATTGLLGAFAANLVYRQTMPELALPGIGLQATVTLALCGAGLLECYFPARRAGRVDPVDALRRD